LKFRLTLIIVVMALASMAHAQGIISNLSIGAGFEGLFPAATSTAGKTSTSFYPTSQRTNNSVGAIGDLRYDFGKHSAVGFAFTINRDTEYYFATSGYTSQVQSNNGELIGTYIFRLPSNEKVKPFAMFGGGLVRFAPNNNLQNNVGNTPSAVNKAAFAYGFGTDLKVSDHWGIRLQYRGLVRQSPDYKLSSSDAFGTELKAHVAEPSIQLVYHF